MADQAEMVESTNIVLFLNENFSGLEDSEVVNISRDFADLIRNRLDTKTQFLSRNLRRRDVLLCLLVLGLDLPAAETIIDGALAFLKSSPFEYR